MDSLLEEEKKLKYSAVFPFFLLSVMWSIHLWGNICEPKLYLWGILPRTASGLPGILLAPLLHADFEHLVWNSLSFAILAWLLFYLYRGISIRVFVGIYLLSGIFVWFFGRDSYHLGASGLIYGIGFFLFSGGMIRNHIPLMAGSLFVVFFYGSMVWGMFPISDNLPYSWETHLGGALAGVLWAVLTRKKGPQKPLPPWVDEEEEPD